VSRQSLVTEGGSGLAGEGATLLRAGLEEVGANVWAKVLAVGDMDTLAMGIEVGGKFFCTVGDNEVTVIVVGIVEVIVGIEEVFIVGYFTVFIVGKEVGFLLDAVEDLDGKRVILLVGMDVIVTVGEAEVIIDGEKVFFLVGIDVIVKVGDEVVDNDD
jgi:hypothetical protein